MLPLTEIIIDLNGILKEKEPLRSELIKSFQNKIWDDESIKEEALNETLSELAYDLDFYQPNEDWRKGNDSLYGTDRLEEIIKSALQKLVANK
jgi:hypothetical protein